MNAPLTVDPEFLRRMLGFGGEGDPDDVLVLPGALPDDLPVTLPETPGLHLWGSVRQAAPRWTFHYLGGSGEPRRPPLQRQWRVALDVTAPPPLVMAELRARWQGQGWQSAHVFTQVFVPAAETRWLGVHPALACRLTLLTRQAEQVTQVWLHAQDLPPDQLDHWLGQPDAGAFQDRPEAPLPTLTVPGGWTVQPQGGSSGLEQTVTARLIPGQDVGQADARGLMADFAPQLAAQGWAVLDQPPATAEQARLLCRTPQGYGCLGLSVTGDAVQARLIHVALDGGPPPSGRRTTVPISP